MDLILQRDRLKERDTTGALCGPGGVLLAYVLEDTVRSGPKVYGRTAIPAGRYRVEITFSPRFNKPLPLLHDVPGFSGIRIHPGNDHTHTEGCLLPGTSRSTRADGCQLVHDSRKAFAVLLRLIQAAQDRSEPVWIEIRNPPGHE